MHLTEMFEAMQRNELRSLFVIGENPAQSEADVSHAIDLLTSRDHLVVLDIHLTKTATLADVVLPGSASWCESDGTVTNSERRVQRVRRAIDPPGDARDDIDILVELARRLGREWHYDSHEQIWDEVRRLSPMHAGMSWARLEELGGIQWPCFSDDTLEPPYLHGRLWSDDPDERGRPAPFSVVEHDPPVEALDDEYPLRLTTGRRLDSYNTGSSRVATAARTGSVRRSTCPPPTPSGSVSPTVRSCGCRRVVASSTRPPGSTRTCAPGSCS
jgi:predicted molibdopterin-dependent oxidoreductase YjgC